MDEFLSNAAFVEEHGLVPWLAESTGPAEHPEDSDGETLNVKLLSQWPADYTAANDRQLLGQRQPTTPLPQDAAATSGGAAADSSADGLWGKGDGWASWMSGAAATSGAAAADSSADGWWQSGDGWASGATGAGAADSSAAAVDGSASWSSGAAAADSSSAAAADSSSAAADVAADGSDNAGEKAKKRRPRPRGGKYKAWYCSVYGPHDTR